MRALLLVLIGCGTYTERQLALCHPETGCRPRPFWPDADGDGWGVWDPLVDRSQVAVDPPPGFVANARDCDDGAAEITAEIAGLCPADLPGDPVFAEAGEVEQVAVGGPVDAGLAEDLCGTPGWGGALGASRAFVEAFDRLPVWAASSVDRLDPSWAGAPIEGEGPLLWDGLTLRGDDPLALAHLACARPAPDPLDYQTPAEAP